MFLCNAGPGDRASRRRHTNIEAGIEYSRHSAASSVAMFLCNAGPGDRGSSTVPRIFNPRFCNNHVDANFFDRIGDGEDDAVDDLLALYENGSLILAMPHSVKAELDHPSTPATVKRRAADLVFSMPVQLTTQEED